MDKNLNLNKLLNDAQGFIEFNDGDMDRIWNSASANAGKRGRKLNVLIPVAVVVTVLVSLFSITPVRAAMAGLFEKLFDMMDYMDMNNGDRPDNTAVAGLVMENIPVELKFHPYNANADSKWMNNIQMHVDEAVYDGQNIYLKINMAEMGGNALFGYLQPSQQSTAVQYKDITATSFWFLDEKKAPIWVTNSKEESKIRKSEDGTWIYVAKLSSPNLYLTGNIAATVCFDCTNITASPQKTGTGEVKQSANKIGWVEMKFTFNASSGKNSVRSIRTSDEKHMFNGTVIASEEVSDPEFRIVNRKILLDGCSLSVVSATQSPVETNILMRFLPNKAVSEFNFTDFQKYGYMRIELLDGNAIVGHSDYFELGKGLVEKEMIVCAPFLSETVKSLKVHTVFKYIPEPGLKPIQMEKSEDDNIHKTVVHITLTGSSPLGNVNDDNTKSFGPYQEKTEDIDGGTFTIDLTK